jgi:hypothetical protein
MQVAVVTHRDPRARAFKEQLGGELKAQSGDALMLESFEPNDDMAAD